MFTLYSSDKVIICCHRRLAPVFPFRDYAELVRSRIESMGLEVETVHLSPTVSLADALDDAAQRGLLYAMIITSQHEMHRSVTLTILHGRNPQGKGSGVVNYDSTHSVITCGIVIV